ncbi:hypothetical protein bsdtb5_10690 [Anaeromicropila herbilytica]|uniref:Methyl-accepting chemotaxis protein n=2 Tax=Anaeromicropila herbilytica TaxID=2785025 RepID=A0A7R7EJB8_9FIRM|nr:hypothetical protein bsdtb5_10690 [Anaeromicropila herbilytica]
MEKLFFKNWKIRTKLLVSFTTLILLFLIVIIQSNTTLNDISNKKIPLLTANDNVNESMLLMRKQEKDFLLRERQNETFFKEGKSEYIDNFNKSYSTLKSNVSILLKSNDIKNKKELVHDLNKILIESKIYHDTFLQVVDKTKERGFKDYGIEGELRTAIHSIENSITNKDHIILMLEARRSEKDYFLRHDLQYVDKVNTIITSFKKSLSSSKNENEIKLLDEYDNKFNAIVTIEKEIGLTEADGLNGKYRDAIHKLEPLIQDIHTNIMKMTRNHTNSMLKMMVIVSFIEIVIAFMFALIISKLITNPIIAVNSMLQDIAEGEGDLTRQLQSNTKDEVGTLSKWFNKFTGNIKHIIGLVQTHSNTIAISSNELAKATEHANSKIESIASEMSTITDGLQNSASIIEEATASIDELANGALLVCEESMIATDNSKEVLNAANYGATKLKDVANAMGYIEHSSEKTYDMMKELKESSIKINEIANLITAISGQTNLLSLNANIEAARAGEHGKGFAVVAQEVKQLAEQSKQSADDITVLIKSIEDKIEATYLSIEKEKQLVVQGVEKVNETDIEFKNILQLIEKTVTRIAVISEASNHQSLIAKEMATAMSDISNTTQESASSSQSINLSIQDQVSAFEEIGASIDELSNIAAQLQDQTNRFKTKS